MNARKEDRAEHDPENGGYPAPVDGNRRSYDRSSTGNRREVMAPQDVFVCRNEIDAVIDLVGGRDEIRIQAIDLLGDELRVHEPAEEPACKSE